VYYKFTLCKCDISNRGLVKLVSIMTRLWTGLLGFDSLQGYLIFLFAITSRLALGPTHPLIHWVPGALTLGVKQPGHEADHSPPSSTKVKNV